MSHEYCRYLGKVESSLAPPYISNIIAPTCLSLKRELDLKIFREAVIHVAKNQPNLSHGIAKVGENFQFVPADPHYEYFEILPPETDWKGVCLKYSNKLMHDEKESKNKPGMKVFLISHPSATTEKAENVGKFYIIPVFWHCVLDGTNGMTIVNDILCVYEGMMYGTLNYPRLPNPPSVEDMISSFFSEENKNRYREKRGEFIEHCLGMFKKFNYSLPFEEVENTKISNQFYVSSSQVYEKFLSKCKERNVTVGTVFIAIKYFAYASYAFQEKKEKMPKELFVGVNVPFNLRKRVPLDIQENCVNLAALQNFICPGIKRENQFWEFVDKIRHELIFIQKNNFYLFDYVYIDEIAKSDIVREYLHENGVYVQAFVSNMKRFPHSREYKDFILESIHCVGGLFLPDWDHLELYIYSTDRFNLSYVHRDGGINASIAQYVFSLIIHLTENISCYDENFTLQNLIESFPFHCDI